MAAAATIVRWRMGCQRMLITTLGQTRGLDIISSQRVEEVARGLGLSQSGGHDDRRVLEVGRGTGAGVRRRLQGGRRDPSSRADADLPELKEAQVTSVKLHVSFKSADRDSTKGLRTCTPRRTCPSFRSSVQSTSHPDSAAA